MKMTSSSFDSKKKKKKQVLSYRVCAKNLIRNGHNLRYGCLRLEIHTLWWRNLKPNVKVLTNPTFLNSYCNATTSEN